MPDNLQFHVITILDIEHLHYKCCPNWNKSMYAQKKRSGNHRDMNILDISSHTNQKMEEIRLQSTRFMGLQLLSGPLPNTNH